MRYLVTIASIVSVLMCISSASYGQFPVVGEVFWSGQPGVAYFVNLGFKGRPQNTGNIAYQGQLITNGTFDKSKAEAAADAFASADAGTYPLHNHMAWFDVEYLETGWSALGHGNSLTLPQVAANAETLAKYINYAKAKRPSVKFGYYGNVPVKSLGGNTAAWRTNNDSLHALTGAVDFLSPQCYPYSGYDWDSTTTWEINECRRIAPGKDIFPFVAPAYHGGEGYVDSTRMAHMLNYLKGLGATGVIFWAPGMGGEPYTDWATVQNAGWYKAVLSFMRSQATPSSNVSGSLSANPTSLPVGGGGVTLSWTSQNATSASIDQGVGTVATTGSRTVQVTESKTFTLTLNGTGGPVTSQAAVQVASSPASLATVTLLSPANGLTTSQSSMNLSWNAVPNAAAYEVQVATDESFGSLFYGNTSISTTTLIVPNLEAGSTYYWHVRAKNASVTGSYSLTREFSTTISRTSTAFPVDLQGTPPEMRTAILNVTKPTDADSAYLTMWVFDADVASEGVLRVNGADSLPLFGSIVHSGNDQTLTSFTMSMSAAAWKDGANSLVFVHYTTAGFRIDSFAVSYTASRTGATSRPDVPLMYDLGQNYPNPFNPGTRIPFGLWTGGHVTLTVCNLLGHTIATLVDDVRSAGSYEVLFNATGLPSGVYFYQLSTGDGYMQRRKMLFVK
jgi:hypothetical protein